MPRLHEVAAELLAPINGIVFDKDGTLADLDARWVPFFRHIIATMAEVGNDPGVEQSLAAALGVGESRIEPGSIAAVKSGDETLELALLHLESRGWSRDQGLEAFTIGYRSATFGPLQPIGDIPGTFEQLAGFGYRLGVATSDDRANTLDELVELGVDGLVSVVHCGDDGKGVKPEPEVLWGIAEQWGLEAAQVLFVGDSGQDLATARAAATPFVALDQERATADGPTSEVAQRADAWVASIEELASLAPSRL